MAYVKPPSGGDPHCELVVIGCGNPCRQDDGVGVWIAQRLAAGLGPTAGPGTGVRVYDAGTSGLEVLYAVRGARRVLIVDACRGAGEPGAVFRVPAAELLPRQIETPGLHDFRWQHALYAGCRIHGESFVDRVEVLLIEAESLGYGLELGAVVQAAAEQVLQELRRDVGIAA